MHLTPQKLFINNALNALTFKPTIINTLKVHLPQSAQAAVTECRKLSGLNNRKLFNSSGGEKSKIREPVWLGSGEGSSWLADGCFLCPHLNLIFSHHTGG